MISEKTRTESRALVFWGESRDQVRAFLVERGVPSAEAEAVLAEMFAERVGHIRRRSIHRIIWGTSMMVPAVWVLSAGIWQTYRINGLFFVIGLIGLWRLIGGLWDLYVPDKVRGDVSTGAFTYRPDE